MSLEAEGKLHQVLEAVTGDGRNGKWFKQDFVIEVPGEYPKNICFTVWGEDKAKVIKNLKQGSPVKVFFDLSSKEFKGKWYTEARAWKIEVSQKQGADGPPPLTADDIPPELGDEGDLPFLWCKLSCFKTA